MLAVGSFRPPPGSWQVVGIDGKADARRAVFAVVSLNDHVDKDAGRADRLEHVGGDSRSIGNAVQGDSRLVVGHGDAGQRQGFQARHRAVG